jgi:hypothetical protein
MTGKHAGGRPKGSKTTKPVRRLPAVEPKKAAPRQKQPLRKKPGESGGGRA